MTRIVKDIIGCEALLALEELTREETNSDAYRRAMHTIGKELGKSIHTNLPAEALKKHEILLACTVEDADFLAKGVLDYFDELGYSDRLKLACFWNERSNDPNVKIAPITRQYMEPPHDSSPIVVVLKSIISGTCVVKTNLSKLISIINPDRIFVAAPVMLKGAEKKLSTTFPKSISERFFFLTFREDNRQDEVTGNVLPGIGGDVYVRYGLGGKERKNKYIPTIVKERRKLAIA